MITARHLTPLASRWGHRVTQLLSAGLLCCLLTACQAAQAQDCLEWNAAYQYDHYDNFGNGGYGTPSVSLYGSHVVEAHDGGNGTLWYRTGTLSSSKIIWNNNNCALQYDHGYSPSISLSGSAVVEAHDGGNGTLWYRTGTLSSSKIVWNNNNCAIQYDHYDVAGWGTPSISLSGSTVVEVHDGGSYGTLWYRTGTLSSSKIVWNNNNCALQYDHYADCHGHGFPSISLSGSTVVEAHDGSYGTLWYRTGTLLISGLIAWNNNNSAIQYDHYDNADKGGVGTPSISFDSNSGVNVVEAHDGGNGTLWYRWGHLLTYGQIAWLQCGQYSVYGYDAFGDALSHPAISLSYSNIVEVHDGGNGILWDDLGALYWTQ